MGMMTAMSLADSELTLEDQIGIHFRSNCYPPIPLLMIPVAIAAIDACWEEDYNRLIPLPDGVEFRDGSKSVSASQAVDSLRLDAWLVDDYEEEEDN